MNEKIEINLSSSGLRHAGCDLDLYRTVVQGYKEKAMSSRIIYGIGFHKFIETMYKTKGNIPASRDAAFAAFNAVPRVDDRRSMHLSDANHMFVVALHMWNTAVMQDQEFELLEIDGVPAAELTFSIPLYEDDTCKFNWCGTLDRLGKIRGGCHVIKDWKTTSSWSEKEYFTQYELSRQPRGYVLALTMMHELYPDSILGKIGGQQIGAQFDGIFVKPSPNEVKYGKSVVFQYPKEEIQEFRELLIKRCVSLSRAIQENKVERQGLINGSCEGKWGKCNFWNVCQYPKHAEMLLNRDFDKKPFNPLAYNV